MHVIVTLGFLRSLKLAFFCIFGQKKSYLCKTFAKKHAFQDSLHRNLGILSVKILSKLVDMKEYYNKRWIFNRV